MNLETITDELLDDLRPLRFDKPVTHVYNPLTYARAPYSQYLQRYAKSPKQVVLIGMNPGPWGMAQTGIPFGEVTAVRDWLKIEAPVEIPANMHPKRPIRGFDCPRSEISGKRIWGWVQKRFKTPQNFFARFFISNYCPLQFIEAGGRNRTMNQLRAAERNPLFKACDRALRRTVEQLKPQYVVGVGRFTAERARMALTDLPLVIGGITHPSPANPKANRGWEALVERELAELGIEIS
jgi:single-strand selective monofunctional uracil DNA glycosylase